MPALDVAVIVTSFEMPWHLRRALESIACQTTSRRLEVVVADDGSRDQTPRVVAEFAAQARFPVRFVTHPHTEFHAARCRNEGVRNSSARHLLFFDGDCLLPPDHIEQHLAAWRPGTVTAGYCIRLDWHISPQVGLEMVRSGQFLHYGSSEQRRKLRTMHLKSLLYNLIRHSTKPTFRSTDFLIARDDYVRVNGFDENFQGWGCEDDDFGRRLRAAGIRPVSVLHRTCVYHLWHPPAPSRPDQWKRGLNVAYLQRPIRLTSCLHGLTRRQPQDLTVRVVGTPADLSAVDRLAAAHGWRLETSGSVRTDLELLCRPGTGKFSRRADCRVLACFDDQVLAGGRQLRRAHIVLSPRGTVGGPQQIRLPLDDAHGLWQALDGRAYTLHRAAA